MKNYKEFQHNIIVLSFVLVLTMLLSISCSSNANNNKQLKDDNRSKVKKTDGVHTDEEHNEDKAIKLTAEEQKEFQIEIKKVKPGIIQDHIDLTGEIIPDPTKLAHMTPRFSGIVKEVNKTIGDKVKKGEIIAIIESNESLVTYKMKSAINGTVIDMHMTIGESVNDNSHSITVANLKTVWGNFSIYQKDLSKIKINQSVLITTMSELYKSNGSISYISPMIDEKTRTASARVLLKNNDGIWKPGMFVTAKVLTKQKNVPMVVSKNALQLVDGHIVVFVREKKGFRAQAITTGLQNGQYVEIISGLHQGQEYISKGAFMLKAEIEKESFGDDHGH